ncbi:hypothetical protein [Lactococcus allomyrinae]|uniref:Tape measure protein n=1 Tax=Lactococcus allomyrinae TaxID=2419773 RepID=A0A387BTB1_9LACT|nr:hypothetical protein [Lactococcus allomyrinae]AYG01711.1 hypothetical protein D7I46_11990 [Lactococcus allomyrinae]
MALSGTLQLNIDVNDKDLLKAQKDMTGLENQGKSASSGLKAAFGGAFIGSVVASGISMVQSGLRGLIGELDTSTAAWNNFNSNMKGIGWPQSEIDAAKSSIQKFAQDTVYSSLDISNAFSAMVQGAHLSSGAAMDVVHGFGAIASSANDPKQALGNLIDLYNGFNTTLNRIDFRQVSTALNGNTAQIEKQLNAIKGTNAKWSDFESGSVKVTKEEFQKALALAGTNKALMENATQYKSASQALDGLKETATNALTPLFNSVSQIGIKVFSDLADSLQNIKIPDLSTKDIDAIASSIEKVIQAAGHIGKGFGNAILAMLKPFSDGKTGIDGVATAIGNLADKISSIPPSTMQGIATGIIGIAAASKGIQVASGIFKVFSATTKGVGTAIKGLKAAANVGQALVGIAKGSQAAGYGLQIMAKESKLASVALKGIKITDGISGVAVKMAGGLKTAALAVYGFATGEAVAAAATGALSAAIAVLTSPITWIIAAIAAVVAALVWFFTQTKTGRQIVATVWKAIQTAIQSVVSWFTGTAIPALQSAWQEIQSGWNTLVNVAQTIWSAITNAISTAVNFIGNIISTVINTISSIWSTVWNTVLSVAATVWNGIMAAISPVIAWLSGTFVPLFQAIGNLIVAVFNFILAVGQMVWRLLMQAISIAITFISNIITTILSVISATWNTVWTAISTFLSATWTAITNAVSVAINAVMNVINTVLTTISAIWNTIWSAISAFLAPIWATIQSVVSTAINAVMNVISPVLAVIQGIWNTIWSAISAFIGPIWDSIKNVIDTAINAVKDVIQTVLDTIKNAWDTTWNALSGVVQKVMDTVTSIVQGAADVISNIIGGITDTINGISKAVNKATDFVKNIGKLEFTVGGDFQDYPRGGGGQLAYAGYGEFQTPDTFNFGSQNVSSPHFDTVNTNDNSNAPQDERERIIIVELDGKTIAKATVDETTRLQKIKEKRR